MPASIDEAEGLPVAGRLVLLDSAWLCQLPALFGGVCPTFGAIYHGALSGVSYGHPEGVSE